MSTKSARLAALSSSFASQDLDPRYLAFFDCFNRGCFFEAHEVLEDLWLGRRGWPEDHFYKGLIQLAGAFVHLQKNRLKPAAALFRLAAANLAEYPSLYNRLDLDDLGAEAGRWLAKLELGNYAVNPLRSEPAPWLHLQPA